MEPLPLQIRIRLLENDHGLIWTHLQLANLHLSLLYNVETVLQNPTIWQKLPY